VQIVKLHTIDSTNDYLKRESKLGNISKDTLAWAKYQSQGRGQMGTSWQSEKESNLTFSIYRKSRRLSVGNQCYITMAASLAVYDALDKLMLKKISVKWPNDIMSDRKKIAGILIESVIKSNTLDAVIIGIGLNVNQTNFENLPKATSIKEQLGIHFHLEEILQLLISQFHTYARSITSGDFASIKAAYEDRLYRKDKPSTFQRSNGEQFVGIIRGVNTSGQLILEEEDQILNTYNLKELSLLF